VSIVDGIRSTADFAAPLDTLARLTVSPALKYRAGFLHREQANERD
jgi:hypothetical protein